MKKFSLKEDELSSIINYILNLLKSGGVVILKGDLASGKTTLTKSFVKYLGITEEVTSPTFSIQQCYGKKVYHYDIYNDGVDNFLALGLLEELEKEGYHLIEWGDDKLISILHSAQIPTVVVNISKSGIDIREYEVDYA